MKERMSRALVPVISRLPSLSRLRHAVAHYGAAAPAVPASPPRDYDLVRFETHLRNRDQVERFLPDILGRALARIWIDPGFRDRFGADPVGTLADYGVFLPDSIEIDFVTEGTTRPQVVVYERPFPKMPRKRLLYLQLILTAAK
ncbi:hypothetical protein [Paragemmobacter ruber]|uniref:Uncharacterized protein n=1 Tax=Paragemmobacter ruber TaxID=1985673 RepID=A0ABW9Y9E9_9RHOB|nr:hypothetical protein [Rhodobacter ruber]NBE09160.1 hypothetical protein [Rhodobacter ruber]